MRVIVEQRTGAHAGRKALIDPGKELRVGRTTRADLVVDDDPRMSGAHFALSWDGAVCLLTDLRSTTGTELNGERTETAEIENGDSILAGDTAFSVSFEGLTPARSNLALTFAERQERADKAARALQVLRAEKDPLFALLDSARDFRILDLLREAPDEARSLYEGLEADALEDVAPYLVAFRKDSGLLERLVEEGWGASWAVFLTSKRALRDVRAHFRKLLVVETEKPHESFYFRFYDPRVLTVFLPTCTPRQLGDVFGDTTCFVAESETGAPLRFTSNSPAPEAL